MFLMVRSQELNILWFIILWHLCSICHLVVCGWRATYSREPTSTNEC